MTYLAQLFGVSNYMPHGYCFLWRPDLLMLHVGSDAVITLSYFSIPAAILMMVRKRPDADHRVAQLFIAFIALCGLTHLMNIVVIWYPAYAIEGLIKLATALVSLTTAVVLWPLIPRIAAMPSRQQLEQRNREIENLNSKLQQRIDSLGTLAGGVAHDFNNLLTVIKGHAHLLEQSRERDTINENLQAITIAADRAADVCRQMLAYSGRGHFMLVPTDLNSIVGEVKMSGQSGCNLTYSLSTNLHTIDASAEQMHQLVNDLVNNCIEAIQEAGTAPGEVSIQTYNATLSEADLARAVGNHDMTPGDAVILEVTDNGVGMPPQVIDRLFEPYYSTKFVGRGLGMAAVQGIVRGHHGCLFVDSTPGQGTRIQVAFPVYQPKTTRFKLPEVRHPGTILVVDDEPEVLALARQYLTALDIKVFATTDPDEALGIVRRNRDKLDAVIVDFLLPYTTGSELIAKIEEIRPVDVYVTSGYTHEEIDDPTLRRYLTGYIAKPFAVEDFRELFAKPPVAVN